MTNNELNEKTTNAINRKYFKCTGECIKCKKCYGENSIEIVIPNHKRIVCKGFTKEQSKYDII